MDSGRVKSKSPGIFPGLLFREITGRRSLNSWTLPSSVSNRVALVSNVNMSRILQKLRTLDRGKLDKVKKIVSTLAHKICEYPATDETKAFSEAFVLFHGVETLLDLIWHEPAGRKGLALYKDDAALQREPVAVQRSVVIIQGEILSILREVSFLRPGIGPYLGSMPGFLDFLFGLVKRPETFDNAVSLIEEIIASGDDVYDLTTIPDVQSMLHEFNQRQLAFFCRLLALICYEPERARDPDKVIKSLELLKSKASPASAVKLIVTRNNDLLMNVDGLLERFLKLCYVGNYPTAAWTEALPTSPAHLLELLVGADDRDDWEDLAYDLENDMGDAPVSLKMLTLATYQVEVIFTLSTLLSGPRKLEAQRRLVDVGLVDVMNKFLDKVTWQLADQSHDRLHGPRCECNPESALKTQFLRLVLNYCECQESKYKQQLLSDQELAYIGDASRAYASAPFGKLVPEPDKLIGLEKGVISKLVQVFIYENPESSFRFWLGSSIEAFLLNGEPGWQLLLAQRGLLSYLVRQVMKHSDGTADVALQTACDSLAELLKGNAQMFSMFNAMLPSSEFNRFMSIVLNNLVDSNVFYRSLMLSIDRFHAASSTGEPYPFADCQVARFVSNEERKLSVFCSLQESICLHDISQENICVLNTSILFFLLASRGPGGKTSAEAFFELVRARLTATDRFETFRNNFIGLLEFWKIYYTEREGSKEKENLERSSRIPFKEWFESVKLLSDQLGPDSSGLLSQFSSLKL